MVYSYSMAIINDKIYSITEGTFFNRVFAWMGLGLGLTALVSYLVYSTPSLLALLVTETAMTGLGYLIMFAPIGFVLVMSF